MNLLDIRTQIGCTQETLAEKMGLSLRAYQRAEKHGPVKQVHILAAWWIQFMMCEAPSLNDAYSAARAEYRGANPIIESRDV